MAASIDLPGHGSPQVLVASNRGPVTLARDPGGEVVPRRGGGGLVTALTGVLQARGGTWFASAMSEEDRAQAGRGPLDVATEGASYRLQFLAVDPETYDRFYNGMSNRVLWFCHHYLWDVPRAPRFDEDTYRAWSAYREVNRAFAQALLRAGRELRDPAYLVQDYHLCLVPAMLRRGSPGARISHFSHIPFAGPSYLRILPRDLRGELLAGLLGADVVGFQAPDWADNFLLCCRRLEGAAVDLRRRVVRWEGRRVRVRVYPISIDPGSLRADARAPEVAAARRRLEDRLGQRRLILRVDRVELSKNILRGFLAYEELLARHPGWRGRVTFLACLNPSREGVPEYGAYLEECQQAADRVNERFGDRSWQPVEVEVRDDLPEVLAAYGRYDVLLVNPVYDGMNLVAKEGPVLNRRQGVLVLSENAGAFRELGRHAVPVNPFDVRATAEALALALDMDPGERARRARALRRAVLRSSLDRWISRQLEDLGSGRARS